MSRRSTRSGFTDRPISDETLTEIIDCGLAAPSSKNAQPWKLHVVTDRDLLIEIADEATRSPGIETYVPTDAATGMLRDWDSSVVDSASILRQVPVAIFIENRGVFSSGRTALTAARQDVLEAALIGYTFEAIGLGTSIQNMSIAAHALGVQGVFIGDVLIVEDLIAIRLGIQTDLVGVLALGYSSAVPEPRERARVNDELVSWVAGRKDS